LVKANNEPGAGYSLIGPQQEIETSTAGYSQHAAAKAFGLSGLNAVLRLRYTANRSPRGFLQGSMSQATEKQRFLAAASA
jgi:hypothetical protein